MSDLLSIALDAATQAGQLIKSHFGSDLTVNEMQRHDIKLELDVRSQKLITEIILKNDPRVMWAAMAMSNGLSIPSTAR